MDQTIIPVHRGIRQPRGCSSFKKTAAFSAQTLAGRSFIGVATMFLDVSFDVLLAQGPRRTRNFNPSRNTGNGQNFSGWGRLPYGKRMGLILLAFGFTLLATNTIGQTAKESIDVPPHTALLLRATGSGDQVYRCIRRSWVLEAPDAKLFNQEGALIGRHFAGPTWQLKDGSWVKGEAIAKQPSPDATAVPWLLLESVGGAGRLSPVRFIQRTGTKGGNAPEGNCSESEVCRVPYTATYSFYVAGK